MQLYSTNNPSLRVSFQEALFKGLPDDNGLFMPLEIPLLSDGFIKSLTGLSFQEIAFETFVNAVVCRQNFHHSQK